MLLLQLVRLLRLQGMLLQLLLPIVRTGILTR
nr:MAG TPA: hypothetical protein [Microviridae sp.]